MRQRRHKPQLGTLGNVSSQSSSPSLATFRREAEAEQRPRRQSVERLEARRHHYGVKREQNQAAESQGWCALAEPPDCYRSHGRKPQTCTVLYEITKALFQKGLDHLVSTEPASPNSADRSDTTCHLTVPPQCAVFQEVIYLPTSIFVRSTCSLKHNENSLPDQFVSEVFLVASSTLSYLILSACQNH